MEFELRYSLSDEEFQNILDRYEWSPPVRVCDLTFGPSGPTSMQTHGWVVRLRQTETGVRMEFKAPANADWSAWSEIGTDVGEFRATSEILQRIGLRPGLMLDRERRTAKDGAVTLSLDDVRGLGRFLELEIETEGADDSDAKAMLDSVRAGLGLSDRPAQRPYGELLLSRIEHEPEFRRLHEEMIKSL